MLVEISCIIPLIAISSANAPAFTLVSPSKQVVLVGKQQRMGGILSAPPYGGSCVVS